MEEECRRYQEGAEHKCRDLFMQIDELNDKEETVYGNADLEETAAQVVIDDHSINEQTKRLQAVIEQTAEKGQSVKQPPFKRSCRSKPTG